MDNIDRNTLFSVEELRDHINRNATRVNRLANLKGTLGVDRTTTATTLRSYIAKGLLVPDHYREYEQETPIFGPEAVEYFTGEPETDITLDYTCNALAKKTGLSDHTIRRHYRAGHIKPIHIERTTVRVPLFIRSKVLDLWYSPKFERTLPSSRLAREDARKAKRTAENKPKPRPGRYQPLKDPGGLARALGEKTRSFKTEDIELPHERAASKESRIIRESRVPPPDPLGEGEEYGISPPVPEPSPPPPEPEPTPSVDALLQAQEARLSPVEYRFLIRGVTQLRTDGANVLEQIAFVNEYLKGMESESDEYQFEREGDELDGEVDD